MNIKRIISLVAALLCLTLLAAAASVLPAAAENGEATYRRKVISVVYDNSGSMSNQSRIHYARYSLQILVSMLNEGDTMVITPMNISSGSDPAIVVETKNGDCSKAINEVINRKDIQNANGGTPFSAVEDAVAQLTSRGLKTVEQAGDAAGDVDYWLVILTDGEFDSNSLSGSLEDTIRKQITPYSSLRTVYLGIGQSATDLSGCGLTASAPFTALKAGEKDLFVEKMQTICNLMSGRYSLPEDYYTVSGSKLTLDLDRADLPFRTLSVLLQDCAATLVSANYNGKTVKPTKYGTVAGSNHVGMADGFFSTLEGSPCFSGGKLELTFSSAIDAQKLTLMGEPALNIVPYYEYKSAAGWQRTDIRYINSNLTPNDYIRVGYEIYEQAHGKKLELGKIFGSVSERVTYAGKSYAVNETIPLAVGTHELGISVSVMDDSYSIHSSVMCIISQNPTYYRIETSTSDKKTANGSLSVVDFVIYSENKPLTRAELANYDVELHFYREDGSEMAANVTQATDGRITAELSLADFKIGEKCTGKMSVLSPLNVAREKTVELVKTGRIDTIGASVSGSGSLSLTQAELLDNTSGFEFKLNVNGDAGNFDDAGRVGYSVTLDGQDVTSYATVRDGVLSYVPTLGSMGNGGGTPGVKTLKVAAWSLADSSLRSEADATLEVVESTLVMTVDPGSGSFAITPFKLNGNTRGFTFGLTLDGRPIDPADGLLDWSISVGDRDVTSAVVTADGGLFYAPTADGLGGSLSTGTLPVTARAAFSGIPSIAATCETSIDIVDSLWELQLLDGASLDIDRFAIEDSGAFFCIRVLRDDVPLGRDELERLWEDGTLTVSGAAFDRSWLLPLGREVTVEEQDGIGVLRYTVTRDIIQPFAGVMAMLISDGEKSVEMSCVNARLDTAFNCPPSHPWSYIWRIAVIVLILYLILFVVLGTRCRSFTPGRYVDVSIDFSDVILNITDVNLSFWERYGWHLQRLVPWHLIMNQPDVAGLTFDDCEKVGGQPRFKYVTAEQDFFQMSENALEDWAKIRRKLSNKKASVGRQMVIDSDEIDPADFAAMYAQGAPAPNKPAARPNVKYGSIDQMTGELTRIIFFVPVR